ncbi:MAG: hypothetical protein HY901_03130 [Deltaproteobacteria bacterium]|nr:hypothetical protein [Deltaproteobacteria bacterium]
MHRSPLALCAALLLLSSATSLAAEKKAVSKDAKVDAKAEAKTDAKVDPKSVKPEAKPAEPKGVVHKLEKLGLKLEGPKLKSREGDGHWTLEGDGLMFTVGKPSDFAPKTYEEAKGAKADYSPEHVTKEEKLEDGWNIQFENRGAMGSNYFVWIRRTIGGTPFICETTASSAEQASKIAKICLSMAKL